MLKLGFKEDLAMPERPNILLITTDQQRFDTIHAAGNPHMRTPHLNWMMGQGIHFSRAYTDCPICMPARVTIMNGRHAFNHGMTSNSDSEMPIVNHLSLPGILTRHGYQTRTVGKMHFYPVRCNYGFEHMELLDDYYRTMDRHPSLGIPMDHGLGQNEMEPGISTVDESHSLTHWIVDRSIDFLDTRDKTRPFFMWTSFSKPHPPFDPCRNYWDIYRDVDVPAPVYGDWSQDMNETVRAFAWATFALNNCHRFDEKLMADSRRAYYACITQIDYNLGLLFARLRELNLLENTWIIFTSDHGEMLGDHHLGAKTCFFEGSAHVPLLIRPPGARERNELRGTRCETLACLADILPTCLDMAGLDLPSEAEVDGLNLLDLAAGRTERSTLFGECGNCCVIENQYKYMFSRAGGAELMFDLEADPYEQHDLIRAGQHVEVQNALKSKLIKRLTTCGSKAVQNGEFVSSPDAPTERDGNMMAWPGFHHRIFPGTDVKH